MARPDKYKTHVLPYLDNIKDWVALGETEKQIQKRLNIGKDAFIDYKKKYPELVEVLKKGVDLSESRYTENLYHRALRGELQPSMEIWFTKTKFGWMSASEKKELEIKEREIKVKEQQANALDTIVNTGKFTESLIERLSTKD